GAPSKLYPRGGCRELLAAGHRGWSGRHPPRATTVANEELTVGEDVDTPAGSSSSGASPAPGPPPVTPPGASPVAHEWVQRFIAPIERFLRVETASGALLLLSAVVAIVIANSTASAPFERWLEMPTGLRLGSWIVERPLRFWID